MRRAWTPILVVGLVAVAVAYALGLPIRDAAPRWQHLALILSAGWMLLVPAAAFAWLWMRFGWSRAVSVYAVAMRWPWSSVVFLLSGLFAMLAFRVSSGGGSRFLNLVDSIGQTLMFFGFSIAAAGRAHVRGPARCRDCGYERGTPTVELARCPECGLDWTRRGAVLRLRMVTRPWIIAMGILIGIGPLVVSMVGLRLGFTQQSLAVRIAPTASIITEVVAPTRGFRNDHWKQLNARALSADQRASLAVGLLDLRLREGRLDTDAENWLDAQAASGSISPELVRRFVAESLSIEIRPLAPAVAGSPVSLGIYAIDRGGWRFTAAGVPLMVLIGEPTDRADPIPGDPLRAVHPVRMGDSKAPPSREAIMMFTPDAPGTHRVYTRAWIARAPLSTVWPATTDSSGQAPRPAAATHWEQRTLTVDVVVAPASPPAPPR